jgi:iron complex outermembrane receptor protein
MRAGVYGPCAARVSRLAVLASLVAFSTTVQAQATGNESAAAPGVATPPAVPATATPQTNPVESSQPVDGSGMQEIVVTAQFRSQNVQDTPLAITAVSGAMMEARSQADVTQVATRAPNVTLTPAGQGFGSSATAHIRGVGQSDFQLRARTRRRHVCR